MIKNVLNIFMCMLSLQLLLPDVIVCQVTVVVGFKIECNMLGRMQAICQVL